MVLRKREGAGEKREGGAPGHPDDHTGQTTDTPGFKPLTMNSKSGNCHLIWRPTYNQQQRNNGGDLCDLLPELCPVSLSYHGGPSELVRHVNIQGHDNSARDCTLYEKSDAPRDFETRRIHSTERTPLSSRSARVDIYAWDRAQHGKKGDTIRSHNATNCIPSRPNIVVF